MKFPNREELSLEGVLLMVRVRKQNINRIRQGDIFKQIEYIEYVSEVNGIIEVSKILFPYVIVLTQDCDLQQDFTFRWAKRRPKDNQDKLLLSVLVAPLYNAEHVYSGDHLSDLGLKMQFISKKKTPGKNLRNNIMPRYHYIEFPPNIPIVPSVIDFKHYFSVNLEYLKKVKNEKFVCNIAPLYREDISQRFAAFLSRIGLPD